MNEGFYQITRLKFLEDISGSFGLIMSLSPHSSWKVFPVIAEFRKILETNYKILNLKECFELIPPAVAYRYKQLILLEK